MVDPDMLAPGPAPITPSAVIFDLDGVLIDSEVAWNEARRELVQEHGGVWRREARAAMMGMSSLEWSRYMREDLGVQMSEREISATWGEFRTASASSFCGVRSDSACGMFQPVMKRTLALTIIILWPLCVGHPASARAASLPSVFGPVFSVGDPLSMFGGLESSNVESPLAAMDGTGRVTLVWLAGRDSAELDAATIRSGGTTASAIQHVGNGPDCYSPALVATSSGRAAVAWLQTQAPPGTRQFPTVTLRMSEQGPDGRFGRPITVWREPKSELAEPYPSGRHFVAIAENAAGDVAIAWRAGRIMVVTRPARGSFTVPVALLSGERAAPALSMDANGQATVMWRTREGRELLVSSWMAGGSPAPPMLLERESSFPPGQAPDGELGGSLRLAEDEAGEELAVWLTGTRVLEGAFAGPGVLHAVWRSPTGAFGPAQTLSAPGIEAVAPTIALRSDGHALVGWSEVTSRFTLHAPKYDTPYEETTEQIHYAMAAAGGQFSSPTALGPRLGRAFNPDAAWLADGSALLAWEQFDEPPIVAHLSAGAAEPAVAVSETGKGAPVIAASGPSDPVIAWTNTPWEDLQGEPLHYAVANGLDGPAHPVLAPVLDVPQPRWYLERGNDLDITVECAERCQLTAVGELLRETGLATDRFTRVAMLPKLQRVITPDRRENLLLAIPRRLRSSRYCGAPFGFELTVTVRGPHGAAATTRSGSQASCRWGREPSE